MTKFCILGIFHWVIGPTDIRFEISASRRSFWHPCRSFIHSRSWEIHFFSFLGGFHWVIGPTDMIFEISASRRSFWHPCRFFNYYRSRVRLKGYIADFFEHSIKPPTWATPIIFFDFFKVDWKPAKSGVEMRANKYTIIEVLGPPFQSLRFFI